MTTNTVDSLIIITTSILTACHIFQALCQNNLTARSLRKCWKDRKLCWLTSNNGHKNNKRLQNKGDGEAREIYKLDEYKLVEWGGGRKHEIEFIFIISSQFLEFPTLIVNSNIFRFLFFFVSFISLTFRRFLFTSISAFLYLNSFSSYLFRIVHICL